MCKHILNAQVSVRAPCCKKWYDCPQCHNEKEDHEVQKTTELVFACKKCKKVFRKDATQFEEADEYCPHCDNHFVIEAKTPQPKQQVVGFSGEGVIDSRVKSKYQEENKQVLKDLLSSV